MTRVGRGPGLWPLRFAGLALVAGGAAGILAPLAASPAVVRPTGGNVPVNGSAGDALDVTAHNSPAVSVDPGDADRIAVASRIATPRFGCGLHVSHDGGVSWRTAALPLPEAEPVACFVPDAAFDADGTLYVAFTSFGVRRDLGGTVPDAIWMVTSGDGGETFSEPAAVGGPMAFHLRLAADPVVAGRLYLTWVASTGATGFGFTDVGSPVVMSRSDDSGATWTDPVHVSATGRERVVAPVPGVGADGELLVAYLDVGDDRLDYHGAHEGRGGPAHQGPWQLVVARSTDGGQTWSETVVDDAIVPVSRFLMLFPPAPALAVDATGNNVHVAFHDARDGDADVRLWSSTDRGVSFAPGRRVNGTPPGDGTTQYLPAVAVADDGRVDVVYYDRRDDPTDAFNEVSLQSSFDGGRSFTPRTLISDTPFDARIGFGADQGLPDLGDRLGLASRDGGALAVWTDTRGGDQAGGKQDLARALIEVAPSTGPGDAARYGGAALAATGAIVLFSGSRRRRTAIAEGVDGDPATPAPTDPEPADA